MAKIAILHEVLGRSKGGIEAWIYHASEELILQGHDVTLFHSMQDLPLDAAPNGVNYIEIPKELVAPSLFFLRLMYNSKRFLYDKLKGFDVVWVRSFTMAWVATKILPYEKTIFINAAPYAFYARRPFFNFLKSEKILPGFLRAISSQLSYMVAWFYEKSAIINSRNVYLSQERKRQTLSFFNLKDSYGKYMVIPAGVNVERFYPNDLNWVKGTTLKIIVVCRLSKDKNVQCIIEAFVILKSKGIKAKLQIVGDGPYKKDLEILSSRQGVDDMIEFVGKRDDVETWYRSSHLFVLPSLYEGFGSVYIEAMASGLPCIAISSKSGKYSVAVDEIIDHGLNGFLMDENNPEELANYIFDLYKYPEKLEDFSKNARSAVVKKFSWRKTIVDLLKLDKENLSN